MIKGREQRRGGEAGACRHGCVRAHTSPRDAADNAHAPPATRHVRTPPPRRALPHCTGGLCDYTRAPPASENAHLSKAVKAATVVVAPEPAATTAAMATASAEATPEPAESAAAASVDATATAAAVAAAAAAAAAEIVLAEAASDPAETVAAAAAPAPAASAAASETTAPAQTQDARVGGRAEGGYIECIGASRLRRECSILRKQTCIDSNCADVYTSEVAPT